MTASRLEERSTEMRAEEKEEKMATIPNETTTGSGEVQEWEDRDLLDLLPSEIANHPDCFDSRRYGEWEDNIATPWLNAHGYKVISWWTEDGDSFGPLVRAVEIEKDGTRATYFYG